MNRTATGNTMKTNSKIVWTPEAGWTDEGSDARTYVDTKGRIRIQPRPTQPNAR
jgi:hypothetical protein